MNETQLAMRPIGRVLTEVPDHEVARRRRDMHATIVLFDEFTPGLQGIDEYSHLIVLFALHRAHDGGALVVHPRGDSRLPLTGVFAARGRNHPNGIGLAVVELLAHAGARLEVRRLDAFDGTPVLDIKPYDHYDRVEAPRVPAWWQRRAMSPGGKLE